jgi:hypothetical protein
MMAFTSKTTAPTSRGTWDGLPSADNIADPGSAWTWITTDDDVEVTLLGRLTVIAEPPSVRVVDPPALDDMAVEVAAVCTSLAGQPGVTNVPVVDVAVFVNPSVDSTA